ncbi:MAG: SDR family oxidoreductase [Candidatus Heimdallarchaeota archaeon]|nr:SDR family oxidoreductase [Candidatus Heimdallarchaeota archaeon]
MKDKIVLVTGANAGIGKETAFRLAEMGSHVILVCRNEKKGIKALDEIKEKTSNENLDLMICDFASLKSIKDFVKNFKKKYKKLDVLINNHGSFSIRKILTEDGIESTFAVNHLGYFSLTLQLLDLLKASSYSRIVNVASSSNYSVKSLNIDDYNWEKRRYKLMDAYAESKIYNIMFTFMLSEKLKGTGITANCLHPGYVKTNIGLNNFLLRLIAPLVKMGAISTEEGAKTSLYLATSEEIEGVTGVYYHRMKLREPNSLALDQKAQQKLWDVSLELTGLAKDLV